jgi:hypothetical protein
MVKVEGFSEVKNPPTCFPRILTKFCILISGIVVIWISKSAFDQGGSQTLMGVVKDVFFVGKGWTTYETLRPLAYSTLADLVHHVRQNLPLADLARY